MTEQRYFPDRERPGAIRVKLTHHELRQAYDIAIARQTMNLSNRAEHYYEGTHDGLWQQTKGLIGETALCLYLGVPLHALGVLGDYKAPDVPPNVEVRCTTYANGPLPIYNRRKDQDDHPFVLAIWQDDVDLLHVTLIGWAYKKDVAREAYWNPKDGKWEIPHAELRPMAELAAMFSENHALDLQARVAKYRAAQAERDRILAAMRPQPSETPAPADSPPADAPAPIEAATPASAPGTPTGSPATSADTSLLERDF